MAGTKRSWEGTALRTTQTSTPASTTTAMGAVQVDADEPATTILSIFGTFRDELDEHHDRRERIIKTSRDITGLSKKMLVSLLIGS